MCRCDGEECLLVFILASLVVPPFGWLCGPCIIAGVYSKEQEAVTDLEGCHCLLSTYGFEFFDIPCGIGLPCCLFPCAIRQMLRERLHRNQHTDTIDFSSIAQHEDNDKRETEMQAVVAERYKQQRLSCWGDQTVELTVLSSHQYCPVNSDHAPVFTAHNVKVGVHLWETLAEVTQANQEWWVFNGDAAWSSRAADGLSSLVLQLPAPQYRWLCGLVGSPERRLTALIRVSGQAPFWVSRVVEPTTSIGELWEAAQKNSAELVAEYGKDTEMPVVVQVKGFSKDVTLKAVDLVASTLVTLEADGGHGSFFFSGVKLDSAVCWGEAWASNGMVAGCVLDLEQEEEPTEFEIWGPEGEVTSHPDDAMSLRE